MQTFNYKCLVQEMINLSPEQWICLKRVDEGTEGSDEQKDRQLMKRSTQINKTLKRDGVVWWGQNGVEAIRLCDFRAIST